MSVLRVLMIFICLISLVFPLKSLAEDPAWKWPSGDLDVCWANLLASDHEDYDKQETYRAWTKEAVNSNWGAFSALDFIGWDACDDDFGVGIEIEITWDKDVSNAANVGRLDVLTSQFGGEPGVILNFAECGWPFANGCIVSAALHEFGHAIGFEHEHRRPDGGPSDACLEAHPPRDGDRELDPADNPVFVSDSYDSNSIMGYCPTFKRTFDSISEDDAIGVAKHYGPDPKGTLYSATDWKGHHSCELKNPANASYGTGFRHLLTADCYACPKGYGRSAIPTDWIDGPRACAKLLSYKPAKHVGSWGCPSGAFKNGLYDQCYSCPDEYDRTLTIGVDLTKDPEACVRKDWGVARMLTINFRPQF